ncbi:dynamin family protein [Noviherbaspirillum pedocola]|uniref:Dynamin family protein n=1 Tax=Noviherbaspirillum pedocola TaxID=2801341 RepID=A0A934SQB0_9BURK|nr:dynamin family protein [Noviherbaspirillum pedocola]MBK4734776.1 dynamin family protein [Noviherbaspirillum pedocola]
MSQLVQHFGEYSAWRDGVAAALSCYREAVADANLSDPASDARIVRTLERLAEDRLTVAFVAEFSRGKSELINAIFFADYGQRMLPSSVGRTTMCPTELLWDEALAPSIRLLPIETRTGTGSLAELRAQNDAWTTLPLDIDSTEDMLAAFGRVSETRRVPIAEAKAYELYDEEDPDCGLAAGADGSVEIPRWRHAIVNFPHPLLKQGLVIIDTPGLNAIGTEPELTLNLIPKAHAVLYILAADTGVTRSDIDIWRNHIGAGPGRMVVLNKIDSMWDELRGEAEIERQIARQVDAAAQTLELAPEQIFPVSAQKGLVAKVGRDEALLAKSRLPALEAALSVELIPARREMMRSQLHADAAELFASRQSLLSARLRSVVEQSMELKSLRGKNRNIVEHMMRRIDLEKTDFDASVQKLQGTRTVLSRLAAELFMHLGMDALKKTTFETREAMNSSMFTSGMRDAVRQFFAEVRGRIMLSAQKISEISEMMGVMYRRFSTEHGFALSVPKAFTLQRCLDELAAIEEVYQKQFGAAALLTMPQLTLMRKFFDSIASRVKGALEATNRDAQAWLKAVMAPLETQIREHREQLKQRRASIERIHLAADDLEVKVGTLETMQAELEAHRTALAQAEAGLKAALAADASKQALPA